MNNIIIELTEYQPFYLEKEQLTEEVGEKILSNFSNIVEIDFPSPKTNGKWKITSLGWVGIIRINDRFIFSLKPKVPIKNIFSMWEYAYGLKSYRILDGLVTCDSVKAFYNIIASLLAKHVIMRCRKGLYKTYEDFSEKLPFIAGRIDIKELVCRPYETMIKCDYQDNTYDNMDNKIILWTLYVMLRGSELEEETSKIIKKAFMAMQNSTSLQQISFDMCMGRSYNSLNSDYKLLHALCRFILEFSGPNGRFGNNVIMPYALEMSRLFEMFVSEWLRLNLGTEIGIKVQENVSFGEEDKVNYYIDIVLYNKIDGSVFCVLDTKYKNADKILNSDINQMVTYLEVKGCTFGVLLYPSQMKEPKVFKINTKTIFIMGFDISKDLNDSGAEFLSKLYKCIVNV